MPISVIQRTRAIGFSVLLLVAVWASYWSALSIVLGGRDVKFAPASSLLPLPQLRTGPGDDFGIGVRFQEISQP
jgi:hypothetical protein